MHGSLANLSDDAVAELGKTAKNDYIGFFAKPIFFFFANNTDTYTLKRFN